MYSFLRALSCLRIYALIILLISATCIISSCVFFIPKYQKPQVDIPVVWKQKTLDNHSENNNKLNPSWWEKFNDPNLNQLINSAMTENDQLKIASGNIMLAKSLLQQVKFNWLPSVNAGFDFNMLKSNNANYNVYNQNNSYLFNNTPQQITAYNLGLIPSYSINIFSQLNQQEMAKQGVVIKEAHQSAVKLTIIHQVIASYIELLALIDRQKDQQKILAKMNQVLKLLNFQIKDGGIISILEVNNYKTKIEQIRLDLETTKRDIKLLKNSLRILTGTNIDSSKLLKNNFNQLKTNNLMIKHIDSNVLYNRPDIINAEAELKITHADIGEARSRFFPNISLITGFNLSKISVANLFDANNNFWNIRINAFMPILNLGIDSLIKQAENKKYIATYNYIDVVKRAFMQIDNAFIEHDNMIKSYEIQRNILKIFKQNMLLQQQNYRLGSISFDQAMQADISYKMAVIAEKQAKLMQLRSIINIYQIIGYLN